MFSQLIAKCYVPTFDSITTAIMDMRVPDLIV